MFLKNLTLGLCLLSILALTSNCNKEAIPTPSTINEEAETQVEARSFPPDTYALTRNNAPNGGLGSQIFTFDNLGGSLTAPPVQIIDPSNGLPIDDVRGITWFNGLIGIQGNYYVAIGNNPNNPSLNNTIYSIDIKSGLLLDPVTPSSLNFTPTDLCWADFTYLSVFCGLMGAVDGLVTDLFYLNPFNNFSAVHVPIIDPSGLIYSHEVQGLTWIYEDLPTCPGASGVHNANLHLSTYEPASNTYWLYTLQLTLNTWGLSAEVVYQDPFPVLSGTQAHHGIGWTYGINRLFFGDDPNVGLPAWIDNFDLCSVPLVPNFQTNTTGSVIPHEIEDFVTSPYYGSNYP